jgi:hypothetical protein
MEMNSGHMTTMSYRCLESELSAPEDAHSPHKVDDVLGESGDGRSQVYRHEFRRASAEGNGEFTAPGTISSRFPPLRGQTWQGSPLKPLLGARGDLKRRLARESFDEIFGDYDR